MSLTVPLVSFDPLLTRHFKTKLWVEPGFMASQTSRLYANVKDKTTAAGMQHKHRSYTERHMNGSTLRHKNTFHMNTCTLLRLQMFQE